MNDFRHSSDEWIEPGGLGGFASGTASGIRTRGYHSLLLAEGGRLVLVNGFDAQVEFDGETRPLTSHRYAPDVVHPDGASRIVKFEPTPWPRWFFQLTDRLAIEQEIFIPRGRSSVIIAWKLIGHTKERVKLNVRLFFSGRDPHSLHRENDDFSFESYSQGEHLIFRSYPNVPAVVAQTNAFFLRDPVWYRNFLYREDEAQGLDSTEDLASPGIFGWDLNGHSAVLALAAQGGERFLGDGTTEADFARLRSAELNLRRLELARAPVISRPERTAQQNSGHPRKRTLPPIVDRHKS
jgi:predicted glycogen debranching enzyme